MRRRTLMKAAMKAAGAALLPLPAIAQTANATTLRYVPSSDLTVLDPVWTTAAVTGEHGHMVFDTLYATDTSLRPRPQMAAGPRPRGCRPLTKYGAICRAASHA